MNEELYIVFENYLNNDLSEKEKIDFENQLQNDAAVREKFLIYKDLNGFLDTKFSPETSDFKNNLKQISKSNFENSTSFQNQKKTKVIAFKPWYYAVAASVVLCLGTWFMMQDNLPNYTDYNQHEEAFFTERGEVIKNLKLAQEAFNAKKYTEAVSNFELVLKSYKKPEIEFFYAVSLLEVSKFSESNAIFMNLKSGTSVYKDKATWYLGLSSLKQKNYKEAAAFCKQIPKDSENYVAAQKLLNELE